MNFRNLNQIILLRLSFGKYINLNKIQKSFSWKYVTNMFFL